MGKQGESTIKKVERTNQQLERKSYKKPQLIEYGHLEKLTQ